MTWTNPIDPPADGNAITRAFHITYVKDNLSHLRSVTGGDPSTSNMLLVSTGPAASAWTTDPVIDGTIRSTDMETTDTVIVGTNLGVGGAAAIAGTLTVGTLTNPTFTGGLSGPAITLTGQLTAQTVSVTSRYLAPQDGSAAAPLYAVGAAGTTGLFHGGQHQINFSTQGVGRGWIDDNGNLKWGPSPPTETVAGQRLRIDGRALATAWDVVSERAGKRAITPFAIERERFDRLQPSRYVRVEHDWDEGEIIETVSNHPELGLIADDVVSVYPELSGDGRSLDIYGLVTLCVAMLQETNRRVDAMARTAQ